MQEDISYPKFVFWIRNINFFCRGQYFLMKARKKKTLRKKKKRSSKNNFVKKEKSFKIKKKIKTKICPIHACTKVYQLA